MTRLALPAAVGAVVLAFFGATAATALGGVTDTRTTITVDCAIGEGSNDNQVILPGETLTVTLLNCSDWVVTDLDGLNAIDVPAEASDINTFTVPSATPTYVFTVDDETDLELTFDVESIDIDVRFATPGANPQRVAVADHAFDHANGDRRLRDQSRSDRL